MNLNPVTLTLTVSPAVAQALLDVLMCPAEAKPAAVPEALGGTPGDALAEAIREEAAAAEPQPQPQPVKQKRHRRTKAEMAAARAAEAAAKAAPTAEPETPQPELPFSEPAAPAPAAPAAKVLTAEDLKAAIGERAKRDGGPGGPPDFTGVYQVLQACGAKKLSEVKVSDYATVIALLLQEK